MAVSTARYIPTGYETSLIPPTVPNIPSVKIGSKTYPLFRVPANSPSQNEIEAEWSVHVPNYAGVVMALWPEEPKCFSAGYSYGSDNGVTVKATPSSLSPGDTIDTATNTSITLNIGTPATPVNGTIQKGLSRLSVEIPVCAIDAEADAPGVWYVRGGMSQQVFDEGRVKNSLGGAILLAVGPVTISGILIEGEYE